MKTPILKSVPIFQGGLAVRVGGSEEKTTKRFRPSKISSMNKQQFAKLRLYATGFITIAIWTLLAWDHYHGGVPAHHILAKKDLPAISN